VADSRNFFGSLYFALESNGIRESEDPPDVITTFQLSLSKKRKVDMSVSTLLSFLDDLTLSIGQCLTSISPR
jgi:hypothetical protein